MKAQKQTIGDAITGTGHENISKALFRMMTFVMRLSDLIGKQSERNFKTLGLKKNQIVVDYGCGPARYVKNASEAVGPKGKVYAVDIHPMAIENVKTKIKKYGLNNVEAIHAEGYSSPVPNRVADVVYALDMFHMIENPTLFIRELTRIVTFQGFIIIEDGHQSRSTTIQKIMDSNLLCIYQQNKRHVVCKRKETKCLPA